MAIEHVWQSLGLAAETRAWLVRAWSGNAIEPAPLCHPAIKEWLGGKQEDDTHFYRNARFAFILQLQESLMSYPDKCANLVYPQILEYDKAIEKMDLYIIAGMASHTWHLDAFHAALKVLRDSSIADRHLVVSAAAAHWVAMARRYKAGVNALCYSTVSEAIRRVLRNDRSLFRQIMDAAEIDELALRLRDHSLGVLWFGSRTAQKRNISANPVHLKYLDSVDRGHQGELRMMTTVSAQSVGGLSGLTKETLDELPDETILDWIRADYEAQCTVPSKVLRKHFPDCENLETSLVKKLGAIFFPSEIPEKSLRRFELLAGRDIYDLCVFFEERHKSFFHDGLIAHFSALNAKDAASMFWHSDVMQRRRLDTIAFRQTLNVIKKCFPAMFSELSLNVISSMRLGRRKLTLRMKSRRALNILCQMIPPLRRKIARSFRVVCEEIFLGGHTKHEAYDEVMEHLPILYRALSEKVSVANAWKMIKECPSTRDFAKDRVFSLLDMFKFPQRKEVSEAMFKIITSSYSYKKRKREDSSDDDGPAGHMGKIRKIAQ